MAKIIKNSLGNFLVIFVIFSLVTGWFFSGWPRIWPLGKLGVNTISIPPEIQEAQADTTTNSPNSNAGSGWTNPTNAYADGTNAATQTSGNGTNTYSGYGFNLTGNTISQVRVRTDAWSVSTSATVSKNPTANTDGTYPWTNPNQGYTSDGSYATAVANRPTFRAAGTAAKGTTSVIPGLPSDMSANDVVILVASTINDGSLSITASGSISTWTAVPGSPVDDIDTTLEEKLYVWWGVYSSGSTGPTIGGSDHIAAQTIAYYNVNTASPIDVSAIGSEPTVDTSYDFATGLTSNYNHELPITVVTTGDDRNSTAQFGSWGNTSLGSVTERMDYCINTNNGGGFGMAEGTLINPGSVGTWTATLANAAVKTYISFVLRSTTPNNKYNQIYGTFGFTNTSETITKVEVGYEAYAGATGQLNLYSSTNGGSSWSSAHNTGNLGTSDPNSYTYIDITSDFSWTWTLLNDSNFKIKAESAWVSGTGITWSIDALVARVTYNSLANEQIRVAVSWDGGSSWSSNYDTNLSGSELTYWTDVTAATAWTSTKLNDSNFRVSVSSVTVGDTSTVNLDWLPVEVTYTAIVYSVTVEPTSVNYGVMPINDTKASGIITATVGDAATKLNIKGADATYTEGGKCGDGVCTWTLSATQGEDQYVHAFTKNTGLASGGILGSNPATQWVALTKISDENILAASVVANGSQDFKLDMRTPSAAGGETELGKSYSTDVTIVASAP